MKLTYGRPGFDLRKYEDNDNPNCYSDALPSVRQPHSRALCIGRDAIRLR